MFNNQLTHSSSHTEKNVIWHCLRQNNLAFTISNYSVHNTNGCAWKINKNTNVGIWMFTAPVNHNKLDKKKLYKLLTQYWATPTNMKTNSWDKIKILV